MNLTPVWRRMAFITAILGGLLAGPLAAQNVLLTEHDGKFCPVVRARLHAPYVLADGKEVPEMGQRYALQKVEEYLPLFVAVRNLEVKMHWLNVEGSSINNEFLFRAQFETPYNLDNVFIVLELNTDSAGKVLFLQEVGRLEARTPKWIDVGVPLSGNMGQGKFHLHLFSDGRELLHSNIPAPERDAVVDRMTFKRIAGVQEAGPKPFIGPTPEYPPALLKLKTKGEAVVALRVGSNGQVYDPTIKSATETAFGESALEAVRLWRFLPKVKAGHPVESKVELPFDFSPPAEKSSGKS